MRTGFNRRRSVTHEVLIGVVRRCLPVCEDAVLSREQAAVTFKVGVQSDSP